MRSVKSFEELRIWRDARALVKGVNEDMKGVKDWGFRDQPQRAGVSVMNNIAEGFERSSDAEFARFLDIAKGAAGEVRSMYYAAEDLGYVKVERAQKEGASWWPSRKASESLKDIRASNLGLSDLRPTTSA